MRADLYSQSSFNSLDFSFKTSSGDKINLSMYNNKNIEYQSAKTQNASAKSLTLTHEYGYNFEYVGNGIDEQDMKEINEALKKIKPKIDDFMNQINEDKIFSNSAIANFANELKTMLPKPKDLNHTNMIFNKTLNLFDSLLEEHKAQRNLLERINKLFENLIDTTNKFSLYV